MDYLISIHGPQGVVCVECEKSKVYCRFPKRGFIDESPTLLFRERSRKG
jgi:hypothetical protein